MTSIRPIAYPATWNTCTHCNTLRPHPPAPCTVRIQFDFFLVPFYGFTCNAFISISSHVHSQSDHMTQCAWIWLTVKSERVCVCVCAYLLLSRSRNKRIDNFRLKIWKEKKPFHFRLVDSPNEFEQRVIIKCARKHRICTLNSNTEAQKKHFHSYINYIVASFMNELTEQCSSR